MDIEGKHKYSVLGGKYFIIRGIGSGFNSKVKLAVDINSGKQYAVKMLKETRSKFISSEVATLSQINHENIINLVDFLPETEYVKKDGRVKKVTAIVLELAQGGEVFDFLFRTGRFSEEVCRYYFRHLIESLEYIHNQGFTHRDLKPENLLFTEDFQLKLADFGFSTLVSGPDGNGLLTSNLGTKGYMAPEIILKTPYHGPSVDLFATGVILFIMLTGAPPFGDAVPNDPHYKLVVTNKHDYFWYAHSRNKSEDFYSAEFKDLLNFMLAFDPAQRLNISEIKSHPWYNGPVPSAEAIRMEMLERFTKVQEEAAKEKEEKKKQASIKKAEGKKPAILLRYPVGDQQTNRDIMSEMQTKFPNLNLKRNPVVYDETSKSKTSNDYFCAANLEVSLISLLYVLKQKSNEVILNDKTYKVSAKCIEEEDGGVVQLKISLFKNDEDTTYIRFEKQSGNLLKFLELVKFFEQSLNELTKVI